MAGFRETDTSPLADALVLAVLFIPFIPVVAIAYTSAGIALLGCPADTALACSLAGLDLNALHGHAVAWLKWSARTGASGALLAYICGLALLAQLTTEGFRGRIVRTCAVIMWAGVLPLLLGVADLFVRSPQQLCNTPCTPDTMLPVLANLGRMFVDWIASTAVPLGVLMALLVALTMGYRLLIVRFMGLVFGRNSLFSLHK